MSESKEMVRGTFLITISILITKVLGVLFIIPFTALIGGQANMAPFTYAYAPYNIAIAIATAGVPRQNMLLNIMHWVHIRSVRSFINQVL